MAQSGSYSARAHEDEEKRQFFFDSIATTRNAATALDVATQSTAS